MNKDCKDRKPNDIIVVGVNHYETPVHLRERFSVAAVDNNEVLERIAALPNIQECVVLSTCNRTEIYAVADNVVAAISQIENFLLSNKELRSNCNNRWLKLLRSDALLHLFRVASGLESMILGEAQILSQVKNAHQMAVKAGTIGSVLEQAFKSAVVCGKKVRSETEIGWRPVSLSSVAVELGRKILAGSLRGRCALVVGAGEMARLCSQHFLSDRELQDLKIVTRSGNFQSLASCKEKFGSRMDLSCEYEERHNLAANADLVVVATSSPQYVLSHAALKEHMEKNNTGKPLCVIDISVPRNVDPEIASIEGVRLFHADDLSAVVAENKAMRETLLLQADAIVFAELDAFA